MFSGGQGYLKRQGTFTTSAYLDICSSIGVFLWVCPLGKFRWVVIRPDIFSSSIPFCDTFIFQKVLLMAISIQHLFNTKITCIHLPDTAKNMNGLIKLCLFSLYFCLLLFFHIFYCDFMDICLPFSFMLPV